MQADKQSPTTVGELRTMHQSLTSHDRIRQATPSIQKALSTDTGLYLATSPLLQLGFDAFRYVCMYVCITCTVYNNIKLYDYGS